MARVVKVKKSDIAKIVMEVAYGKEFDDFDTKIQPEELPQDPEIGDEMNDEPQTDSDPSIPDFLIGKTEDGRIVVTNTKTGQLYSK